MSARRFRRPNLLLTVPMVFAAAAFVSFLASSAPATPDPLNPVLKAVPGPFREQIPEQDHSEDPSPAYSEEERRQLLAEGKDLFFSRTAFGQRPSQGPLVFDQAVSCATCHDPALGFADGLTHPVGPVRERELARRQSPSLLGVAHTAPFGWDGRNPTLQAQARGAIVSPLEMNSSREPTRRELDALAEFQATLAVPKALPGTEYDAARAARGEVLFRTPRPVTDPTGEFPAGADGRLRHLPRRPVLHRRQGAPAAWSSPATRCSTRARSAPTAPSWGSTPRRCSASGSRRRISTTAASGTPRLPATSSPGALGRHSLDGDIGAHGAEVARRALLDNVLPFYNTVRFNFRFTDEELADLAEFLLSL